LTTPVKPANPVTEQLEVDAVSEPSDIELPEMFEYEGLWF